LLAGNHAGQQARLRSRRIRSTRADVAAEGVASSCERRDAGAALTPRQLPHQIAGRADTMREECGDMRGVAKAPTGRTALVRRSHPTATDAA